MKKILIVDDEPHIVNIIRLTLSDKFDVHTAFSGQEALSVAQEVEPDLIILDLMMPAMDGIETCKRIRELEQTKKTPVMILSAKSQIVDKFQSISAGADDYMVKPFEPSRLLKRVENNLAM